MRGFLRMLLLRFGGYALALLAWLGLVAGAIGRPTPSTEWAHENYVAKTAAAESVEGPRILMLGGSSALYGLRADEMTRYLGRPVINFGNFAGLGLDYVLHRADQVVRAGDVVILALEYEMYWVTPDVDPVIADFLISRDPAFLRTRSPRVLYDVAMEMTLHRLGPAYGVLRPPNPRTRLHPYLNPHLDGFGDTLANATVLETQYTRAGVLSNPALRFGLRDANLATIDAMAQRWRARGATVMATSPPLRERDSYAQPAEQASIARLTAWFAQHSMPLLVAPHEAMYPTARFFDSHYHLDSVGAVAHTRILIERLQDKLPATGHSSWWPREPDHAFARLAHAAAGWEPMSNVEGPDSQDWSRPPYFELHSGANVLRARTNEPGEARLRARVLSAKDDVLRVEVEGETRAECRIAAGREETIDISVGDVQDVARVVLRHGQEVEAPFLRLDWGQPRAPVRCEAATPDPR